MMNPLVTIAIPTYKRFTYLKEAVFSSLNQTYKNIEVLVGLDPTAEGLDKEIKTWLIEISKNHPKVRYFFNEHNLGLAGNWNAHVERAQGEYIIIIGDDDHLLPAAIETLVSVVLEAGDVVFSNHFLIDHMGKRLEEESIANTRKFKREGLKEGLIENSEGLVWQNAVPISAALLRRQDVRRLRFKEDLNTPEIELLLRLSKEGGKFYFIPEYLVEYRIHPQSATSRGLKVQLLLKYLVPFEVSKKNEVYKMDFIRKLIGNAITLHIREGEIGEARKLYWSKYHPLSMKVKLRSIVQLICICFGPSWGSKLLNLFSRLK